jgi:hypothetical protein
MGARDRNARHLARAAWQTPAVTGRRAGRVCSPRCRIARWRQTRTEATAAELARLHTENATLRQRVAELERLVEPLKVPPLADDDADPLTRSAPALGTG